MCDSPCEYGLSNSDTKYSQNRSGVQMTVHANGRWVGEEEFLLKVFGDKLGQDFVGNQSVSRRSFVHPQVVPQQSLCTAVAAAVQTGTYWTEKGEEEGHKSYQVSTIPLIMKLEFAE